MNQRACSLNISSALPKYCHHDVFGWRRLQTKEVLLLDSWKYQFMDTQSPKLSCTKTSLACLVDA